MTEDKKLIDMANVREAWVLFILFGLAVAVRLYLAFHTYVIANDGVLYIKLAQLLSQGKVGEAMSLHLPSLFPIIIASFQKVFVDWELSGQMVSVLFGSLTIIPFYFLTKELFNRNVAFTSSILFIFHPYLVRFSAEVIKEPTFWFFSLMGIWVGWNAITLKKVWLFVLTGLLGIASFLLRIEGFVIFPIIIAWIFLKEIKLLRSTYKQRILYTLVLCLTLAIILSPAMLYIKEKTGSWNLARIELVSEMVQADVMMYEIKKNLDKVKFSSESGDQRQADFEAIRLRGFLSLAKDHRIAIIWFEAISKFFKVIHPVLIIPLFFGIMRRKKIKYRKEEELFLLSVFTIFFLILIRYGTIRAYIGTRHMVIPALVCLPWVGVGVLELGDCIRSIFLSKKANENANIFLRNVGWFLMFLIALLLLPQTLAPQRAEKILLKEAGIWIRQHGPKDPVVMTPNHLRRIAFYANGIFLEIPGNQDLAKYAKEKRVDFLAVDKKDIEQDPLTLLESLKPEHFREEVVIGKPSEPYEIKVYSMKKF